MTTMTTMTLSVAFVVDVGYQYTLRSQWREMETVTNIPTKDCCLPLIPMEKWMSSLSDELLFFVRFPCYYHLCFDRKNQILRSSTHSLHRHYYHHSLHSMNYYSFYQTTTAGT